jgi:hypothetical protein
VIDRNQIEEILMMRRTLLAIGAVLIPGAARAQGATPPMTDAIGWPFRETIDSVAATAGIASLRDRPLPPSVRREIRAYVGFGLVWPQHAVRLWEDADGAHGWFGLWWEGPRLDYEIAGGTEADYVEARQEQLAWVRQMRDFAAKHGCRKLRTRPDYETCTLPPRGVRWAEVLARLDSLGVARLPQQRDRLGIDGVTLVVEYRDAAGFRAYSYSCPRADAEDTHERMAAAIMDAITDLSPLAHR